MLIKTKEEKIEELESEVRHLNWQLDELEDDVNGLYREIDAIRAQYRALGLRDPDTYSIVELSEIKAAIERITSPTVIS